MLAAGLIAAVFPAVAAPAQERDVSDEDRAITLQPEAFISTAAVKVLRHLAQTRNDVQNPNHVSATEIEAAQDELTQAQTLLNAIQDALPTSKVKNRLWTAKQHLAYEDPTQVLPELALISDDLVELADYLPTQASEQHLDNARKALEKGDRETATKELEATEAALVYTEIDMPLTIARQLIANAKAALQRGDIREANRTLKTAETAVTFLSVASREPLIKAKNSLWQAMKTHFQGAYDTSKRYLVQAVQSLNQATETSEAKTRQQTSELLNEATELEATFSQNVEASKQALNRLWQRAENLSEQAVEYLSLKWQQLSRSNNAAKEALIEAKLHIGYAKIEQFSADNIPQAKIQLAKAESYMEQADNEAEVAYKPKITALQERLKQLDKALDNPDQNPKVLQDEYDNLRSALRLLIQSL